MPTVAKTSAQFSKLGDLSAYNISSSAVPVDTADSAGSIPTFSATFTDGENPEYLMGESLTISNPTVGSYDGDVVNYSKAKNTNRYNLDIHSIMSRLNSTKRIFPVTDYAGIPSVWLPASGLEYWTQQCGIFNTKVDGDVIFYQSQFQHFGAWGRGITRALKSGISLFSGSESFGSGLVSGRLMNILPRDSQAVVTFPSGTTLSNMGSYPSVLIPPVASGNVMVFGGTVYIGGTGRQGLFYWTLTDPTGAKRWVKLQIDAASGFVLQTSDDNITYTTHTAVAATSTEHTFYLGMTTTSTATNFTLRVLDTAGTATSQSVVVTGSKIKGSMALTQVLYRGSNVGSGLPFLYSDIFVSSMAAIPTVWPVYQKAISPGVKETDFHVGFSGNVWEHIKQYCSIYHLDVSYTNGKLTIGPRQKDVKTGHSLSELTTSIQDRETAQYVEVVNQQHTPTGGNAKVLWAADTVYQVAVGEVQEFTIQTDHSIMEVSQPICVTGISPYPYTAGTGQYVVTGSDGYIVSPTFWADQGGSITCDITGNDGEIKVRIKGPDLPSTRAPYRISEGDAGRPALYITGQGVKADPVTLKVATGKSKAAKEIGATIDCPFIGTKTQAYDAAARAARAYATPDVTVTVAEPNEYDQPSKLGTNPAGALIRSDGNVVRLKDITQSHSMLSGQATQHNTIYQIKRSFAGATIGAMNAYYNGKPIGKINLKPMKG